MNLRTCLERPTPPPSPDQDVGSWMVAVVGYVFSTEAPCGKPATHLAFGHKPLCEAHAHALRERLRTQETLANVLREGFTGRRLTEADIARLVCPIEAVS
jgi:hypothetical protein